MTTSGVLTSDVMSTVKYSGDIREEFGRFMQQIREAKGLTQKFVAKEIGITVTQLSRIENGKSGTERDTVIEWARAIGIDENEALRQFKPETDDELVADGLFSGYYDLPEDRRELARKQIAAIISTLKDEDFPE